MSAEPDIAQSSGEGGGQGGGRTRPCTWGTRTSPAHSTRSPAACQQGVAVGPPRIRCPGPATSVAESDKVDLVGNEPTRNPAMDASGGHS